MTETQVSDEVYRWYMKKEGNIASAPVWAQMMSEIKDQIPPRCLSVLRDSFHLAGATDIEDLFNRLQGRAAFTGANRVRNLRTLYDALPALQQENFMQKLLLHIMAIEALPGNGGRQLRPVPRPAQSGSSTGKPPVAAPASSPVLINLQAEWQVVADQLQQQLPPEAYSPIGVTFQIGNRVADWLQREKFFYSGPRNQVQAKVSDLYYCLQAYHDLDCCFSLQAYLAQVATAPAVAATPQPKALKKILGDDEPMQCFCGGINIRYVIVPCGHGLCTNCVSEQDKCISCGTRIGQFLRLAQHQPH